jgi:hypothetical protein
MPLDPTFATNITYTNGNTTVTANSAIGNGNWNSSKSTVGHRLGKWYFEVTINQAHNFGGGQWDGIGIGILNIASSPTTFPGQSDSNGCMFDLGNAADDLWYSAGHGGGYGGSITLPGNTIALAVDLDNSRVWFRDITRDAGGGPFWWGANANGTDNPLTPSTGFPIVNLVANQLVYYSLPIAWQGEVGAALPQSTVNDTSGFAGVIPSGFNAWDAAVTFQTQWNPLDKDASMVLTNGNLTATQSGAAGTWTSVRSTDVNGYTNSGKLYFEITSTQSSLSGGQTNFLFGIGNRFNPLNTYLGQASQGFGVIPVNSNGLGWISNNSGHTPFNQSPYYDSTVGHLNVYGVAVDLSAKLMWVIDLGEPAQTNSINVWNFGWGAADPGTGTGGFAIPAGVIDGTDTIMIVASGQFQNSIPDVITLNAGNTPFTIDLVGPGLPSGFSGWDASGAAVTGFTNFISANCGAHIVLAQGPGGFTGQNTRTSISGASVPELARATDGYSTGKYYFEAYLSTASANNSTDIGVCTAAATASTIGTLGGVFNRNGVIITNGSTQVSFLDAMGQGSTNWVGVAVDLGNSLIWLRAGARPHSWQGYNNPGDPAAGTGGYPLPAGTFYPAAAIGNGDTVVIDWNFGQAGWMGGPPDATFLPWSAGAILPPSIFPVQHTTMRRAVRIR